MNAPLDKWLAETAASELFRFLEISNSVAIDAFALPGEFHKNPGDRIIVATARIHKLTIITSDLKILAYPHVRTLSTRR